MPLALSGPPLAVRENGPLGESQQLVRRGLRKPTYQESFGWAMRASDTAAKARTARVDLMMSVMDECFGSGGLCQLSVERGVGVLTSMLSMDR